MTRTQIWQIGCLLIISILCNGCFTPMLWEATDPNKSVTAKSTEVSEDELKSRGVKYFKSEDNFTFYLEKDSIDKFKDYTYRVLGTPVTVALDAGSIAFILIGYMLGQNEVDKAIDRGKEAEATKYGYKTEPPQLPR